MLSMSSNYGDDELNGLEDLELSPNTVNGGRHLGHNGQGAASGNNGKTPGTKEAFKSYKSLFETGILAASEPRDVALDESKYRWSSENDEFVTPWYTYVVRILMLPTGVIICLYIWWRISNYSNVDSLWQNTCAWTFIISEAFCLFFIAAQWVWMWNLKFRKRITQKNLNMTDDDLPTIDIMIPCYTEPTEIVQMTLNSCYDLDYPAHKITVYICDDGKNVAMREMVSESAKHYGGEMRTRYIARIKVPGVPHHAKAGNLNNCILNEGSTGQLIIILDCDMLPEPCLARTVVPFFYKIEKNDSDIERSSKAVFDEKMGLLQTPQAFYNLDSHDVLGQSYSYFYECVISGWDGTGCTPCCGTGVTFSRFAMESVGGFSTGSITEDFKTSLNLRAHGFKCKYFLQYMTRGVSPKELNAFMTQRLRWCVGAIQILKAENPLFVKGLPFQVRWLYFFSTIGMVYVIPICLMLLVMYGTIISGVPINFGPTSFLMYLALGGLSSVLIMAIQYLISWRLSFSNFLRVLQDSFTVSMLYIRAMLIGFCGLELGFACTKKDVSFDLKANLMHAAPHICIYIITGFAAVKAVMEIMAESGLIDIFWSTGYQAEMLYFPLCWTVSLWILISGPPRMIIYGYIRSRREANSKLKCTNRNVPILQELPSTPLNIFPPLSPELWVKDESATEIDEAVSGAASLAGYTHDEFYGADFNSNTTIEDLNLDNSQSHPAALRND